MWETIVMLISLLIFLLVIYFMICIYEQERQEEQRKQEMEDEFCIETIPNENISIVFLAPVRTAMQGLPFFQANMKKVKRAYPKTRLVFIENNSLDETLDYISTNFDFLQVDILHPKQESSSEVANNKPVKNKVLRGHGCQRVDRMCRLRNELMEYSGSEDIVIPVDADWPVVWHIKEFQRAIQYLQDHPEVDAVSPLFLRSVHVCPFWKTYYDSYAFSSDEIPEVNSLQTKFQIKTKHWPEDTELDVHSAFGTMAIYKKEKIQHTYNIPGDVDCTGKCKCEHVYFNEHIHNMKLLTWFKITAS